MIKYTAGTINTILLFLLLGLQIGVSQDISQSIIDALGTHTGGEKPGCSIAILQDSKVVFSQSYGLANMEHNIPFTSGSVSDIGSVAKQFTCFAILLLEAEGKLSIEDPISKYFEGIPDFGNPILVKHLMSHTSGLREIYGMRAVAGGRNGDGILQEDALRLVQYSKELNFASGDEYNYCNTAYMLLADIVGKANNSSFEEFMQSRIFEPLDMNNTFIMNIQGEWFANGADSYRTMEDGNFQKVFDNSTVQGAGGLYTSMYDMIKWARNLVEYKVGSEAIVQKMRTPFVFNDGTQSNYGFGLQTNLQYGLENFRHSGSSAGYRAFLGHYVEDDLTILIKTNQGEIPSTNIVQAILKHYTGAEIPINQNNPIADNEGSLNMSAQEMDKYTGRYFSSELEMMYEIVKGKNGLVARSLRNGDVPLTKNNDLFNSSEWYLRNIRFSKKGNQITGLRLSNGRVNNLWFERVEY